MNDIIKKTGKLSSIVGGIGIFLVGLIILGISTFSFINYRDLDGKTNATIIDIQKELADDVFVDDTNLYQEEQYNYTVFIDYSVDGKEYKHVQYDNYNSDMKVGQIIEIQYDAKDPSKIQSTNGKTFIYIFIAIGALATIFGGYRIAKSIKMDKENPMYDVMRNNKK